MLSQIKLFQSSTLRKQELTCTLMNNFTCEQCKTFDAMMTCLAGVFENPFATAVEFKLVARLVYRTDQLLTTHLKQECVDMKAFVIVCKRKSIETQFKLQEFNAVEGLLMCYDSFASGTTLSANIVDEGDIRVMTLDF